MPDKDARRGDDVGPWELNVALVQALEDYGGRLVKLVDGRWHHVVKVVDEAGRTVFVLDGKEV